MKCNCLKRIHWGKVLLCALIYLIITYALRQAEVLLTIKYYMMPEYFGVWSKLMMPTAGPPPIEFTLLSILFIFLAGIVLAATYDFSKELFGKPDCEIVSGFTIMISLFILVFVYMPMFLLFNLPFLIVLSWFITGVLSVFLGTIVFVKILKH